MKNVILGNAFSLQMLAVDAQLEVKTLTTQEAFEILSNGFESAVGHKDTAQVIGDTLGLTVPENRINVTLDTETVLIVGQVTGGRLPEGATSLPEGVKIVFKKVELI